MDTLTKAEKINRLIDQQDVLTVYHYRTNYTALTDDDKKFDALQREIDALESESVD